MLARKSKKRAKIEHFTIQTFQKLHNMLQYACNETKRGIQTMETEQFIKSLMQVHDVNMNMLADKLALTPKTLRARFNSGNWRFEEMLTIIDVFKIENPQEVFFKSNIAY